jgi:sugar (pentulose or hexulose) kinase
MMTVVMCGYIRVRNILLFVTALGGINLCHCAALGGIIARTQTKYVIGIDAGTESVRVGIFNLQGRLISSAHQAYQTSFPKPGHAEQNPIDWWDSLSVACRKALNDGQVDPEEVRGMAVDSTSCSVVALDENMSPLRPCLMWMDVRSAEQSAEILANGQVGKNLMSELTRF